MGVVEAPFVNFSISDMFESTKVDPLSNFHIWQLSCGDACHIWTRCSIGNQCVKTGTTVERKKCFFPIVSPVPDQSEGSYCGEMCFSFQSGSPKCIRGLKYVYIVQWAHCKFIKIFSRSSCIIVTKFRSWGETLNLCSLSCKIKISHKALKFDIWLCSCATEPPVKFQSDCFKNINTNLAASILREILPWRTMRMPLMS